MHGIGIIFCFCQRRLILCWNCRLLAYGRRCWCRFASTASKPAPAPSTVSQQPAVPAEYKSALAKAKDYSDTMHMSKQGIYDQLTSDYGEKFSAAAGQYAVDNLQADYNANALAKAKEYQQEQSMSPAAIHDQLTSDAGEKFTQAQADYAIQHLN